MAESPSSEAARLEQLWAGDFGNAYVDRNRVAGDVRGPFWNAILDRTQARRVLEIGCNVGGNLRWALPRCPAGGVFGVDINAKAIGEARTSLPGGNFLLCPGRELPLRDGWFDLAFTMGVLIHQPADSLPLVMNEVVRCSRRWVLCGEYYSAETVEVPYRGQSGALFKRDYGGIYQRLFAELRLVDQGFKGRDEGWDDITWWLFEKV